VLTPLRSDARSRVDRSPLVPSALSFVLIDRLRNASESRSGNKNARLRPVMREQCPRRVEPLTVFRPRRIESSSGSSRTVQSTGRGARAAASVGVTCGHHSAMLTTINGNPKGPYGAATPGSPRDCLGSGHVRGRDDRRLHIEPSSPSQPVHQAASQRVWTMLTTAEVGHQIAILADAAVMSAPEIESPVNGPSSPARTSPSRWRAASLT